MSAFSTRDSDLTGRSALSRLTVQIMQLNRTAGPRLVLAYSACAPAPGPAGTSPRREEITTSNRRARKGSRLPARHDRLGGTFWGHFSRRVPIDGRRRPERGGEVAAHQGV